MLTALLVLAWSLVVGLLGCAFAYWTAPGWVGLAAVIVTFGHWLAGRCRAIARGLDGFRQVTR